MNVDEVICILECNDRIALVLYVDDSEIIVDSEPQRLEYIAIRC